MNRPLDPEKLEVYQTSLNSSYRLHEGLLGIEDQAPITIAPPRLRACLTTGSTDSRRASTA